MEDVGVMVGGITVGVAVAVGRAVAVVGTGVPVAGEAQEAVRATSASKTIDLMKDFLNIVHIPSPFMRLASW
jgi:hypothetical protein